MIKLIKVEDLEDDAGCGLCPYDNAECPAHGCSGGFYREVPDKSTGAKAALKAEDYIEVPEVTGCSGCAFYRVGDCPGFTAGCSSRHTIFKLKPVNQSHVTKAAVKVLDGMITEELQEPDRYMWRGTEVLPFTFENDLNAVQYAVLKYIYRYPKKQGKVALEKGVIYLQKAIELKLKPKAIGERTIEKFIVANNFTWWEALVLFNLLMGDYKFALEHLEKLIEEVYGTTQEG